MDSDKDSMLYVSFNQDNTAFAVGTERGYRIYSLQTPSLTYYERILDGGIGLIEMLYRSNILVLVGGGKYPKYPQNKVILWDDNNGKIITEITFNGYINNVKIKKERIVIVCDKTIYIFNLLNFQQIDTIDVDTIENKKGLIAITYEPKVNLIAYPDKAIGYVRVKSYEKGEKYLLNAHDNALCSLSFSKNGQLLATSSIEGKHLRLFRTDNAMFVYEFNTGSSRGEIFNMSFNNECTFLSACASSGVVMVFNLKNANEKVVNGMNNANVVSSSNSNSNNNNGNGDDNLIKMPEQSIWSKLFTKGEGYFAEMYIPEKRSIATFASGSYGKDRIVVIGAKGRFYMGRFDEKNGGVAYKEEDRSLGINLYE